MTLLSGRCKNNREATYQTEQTAHLEQEHLEAVAGEAAAVAGEAAAVVGEAAAVAGETAAVAGETAASPAVTSIALSPAPPVCFAIAIAFQ